jgi:hypothetical protein
MTISFTITTDYVKTLEKWGLFRTPLDAVSASDGGEGRRESQPDGISTVNRKDYRTRDKTRYVQSRLT